MFSWAVLCEKLLNKEKLKKKFIDLNFYSYVDKKNWKYFN